MVLVRVTNLAISEACVCVMSLWKLRVGVESYYLAQVASGLDEYYTGAGEASGRWAGGGSSLLGLVDEVTGDDLRAVLAGLAPGTGLHTQRHPTHQPPSSGPRASIMTFAVPKSVSVVYALGDPLVQSAVVEACEVALAESLAWLEREACFVRRGTNNRKMVADPAGLRHAADDRRRVRCGAVPASHVASGRPTPALARPRREHGSRHRRTLDSPRRQGAVCIRSDRRRAVPDSDAP